ncbi:MAG TPA: hypothetical protein VLR46_07830 [Candidatus Dormibacteraeota bacterium]|nr:hypothetical protein [Candidatus Dormibacteraeota bacterium]
MDVRKPVNLRLVSMEDRRKPQRNRTGLFAALTVAAGFVCGLAAVLGIGPFSALHASANYAGGKQPAVTPAAQIEARTLFPSVPPVTKVVNVNDPPRVPRPPEESPKPAHESEGPTSTLHSTPSASPEPGDGSGGKKGDD